MSAGVEGRSWESLRHALSSPRVGLIFHCRNHYAGIFAMREWAEGVSRHGTICTICHAPFACILFLRMAMAAIISFAGRAARGGKS